MRYATPVQLAEVVRAKGVLDTRVLDALERIPRANFVPPEVSADAYLDRPLPIPHEPVTTQPSLVALMVEALELTGEEHVLEIGTGYGFQSALLARLAAFVWSVERWEDLAREARKNLALGRIENVEVLVGDGSEGLREHAPYDAIIVSAAFPRVPTPLADQLAEDGRLVQPIGPGGCEDVRLYTKAAGRLVRRRGAALGDAALEVDDHEVGVAHRLDDLTCEEGFGAGQAQPLGDLPPEHGVTREREPHRESHAARTGGRSGRA